MPLTRSEQMARIRATDTKPELLLRRTLWAMGFRYRLHVKVAGIRPDLIFSRTRLAIFVDGCQWHGCPEHYVAPRTRTDFWQHKLRVNVERDVRQSLHLAESGWRVLRLWEHEIWEDPAAAAMRVSKAYRDVDAPILQSTWRVLHVEQLDDDLESRHMCRIEDAATLVVEQKRSTHKWKKATIESLPTGGRKHAMHEYRIYRTVDMPTVISDSPWVTMKQGSDSRLHCVGTGRSPEQILANTWMGHLGDEKTDEQGHTYTELFSGELPDERLPRSEV